VQKLNLQIRVVDTRVVVESNRRKVLAVIDGRDDATSSMELGSLRLPMWEYDRSFPFPFSKKSTFDGKVPHVLNPNFL